MTELLNGIKEFVEDDTSETEKDLGSYLQDIALYTDADKDDDDNDKVALMTIHQAKGLEFPHVYISGMEENLFPSQMALASRQELEEERRLFYVAITRAEKQLTLSFATSRFRFGTLLPCEPSRFIDEIDKDFLEMDRRMLKSKKTVRPQERQTERFSKPTSSLKSTIQKQNKPVRGVKPPVISDFVPENITDFSEGLKIEHQRFGKGHISKLHGKEGDLKADIDFIEYGSKTLVLKFAKLRKSDH